MDLKIMLSLATLRSPHLKRKKKKSEKNKKESCLVGGR
jgi:hypothetical protein